MIAPTNKKSEFIAAFAAAIENKTFIKISLGKFRGQGEPSKAVATLVLLKDVPHLKLVTSLARKDETKTFPIRRRHRPYQIEDWRHLLERNAIYSEAGM